MKWVNILILLWDVPGWADTGFGVSSQAHKVMLQFQESLAWHASRWKVTVPESFLFSFCEVTFQKLSSFLPFISLWLMWDICLGSPLVYSAWPQPLLRSPLLWGGKSMSAHQSLLSPSEHAMRSVLYVLNSLSTRGTPEPICDRGLILQSAGVSVMNGCETPGNF